MTKNKKILIVITLALVCAITAGVMIAVFLSPERTTVYAFKDNYSAGTPITADILTPVQVDSKVVAAGTSTNTSAFFITYENYSRIVKVGDVLKSDVGKGTIFMSAQIASQGGSEIEVRMDPTAIAVTIPANSVTGVSNSLSAEARVNVYVTYNSGGTYLLLENIRVLAVDKGDGSLAAVTLELNHDQAVLTINAINTGSINLGLVNGVGYITVDDLEQSKQEQEQEQEQEQGQDQEPEAGQ